MLLVRRSSLACPAAVYRFKEGDASKHGKERAALSLKDRIPSKAFLRLISDGSSVLFMFLKET